MACSTAVWLAVRADRSVFYCYTKPKETYSCKVQVIVGALAKRGPTVKVSTELSKAGADVARSMQLPELRAEVVQTDSLSTVWQRVTVTTGSACGTAAARVRAAMRETAVRGEIIVRRCGWLVDCSYLLFVWMLSDGRF